MGDEMRFFAEGDSLDIAISRVIVAGWTGRDGAAVQHHIDELAAIGVPAPSVTPLYYRVSSALLTQSAEIEALGEETSGEAEPLIIKANGTLWLGLASDHTDRGLEAHSVAHSKQICAKPVAGDLWRLKDVADLDALELRSWAWEGDSWTPYQEGSLAAIRPLADLVEGAALADGDAMLCGTLSALGGVRSAPRFRMELRDRFADRAIAHEYAIHALPVIA